ncbi:MAG: hypothetical protein ACXV5U_08730 [Ilumatobacteraceae bacterium]
MTTDLQGLTYLDTTELPPTAWKRGTAANHDFILTQAGAPAQALSIADTGCADS